MNRKLPTTSKQTKLPDLSSPRGTPWLGAENILDGLFRQWDCSTGVRKTLSFASVQTILVGVEGKTFRKPDVTVPQTMILKTATLPAPGTALYRQRNFMPLISIRIFVRNKDGDSIPCETGVMIRYAHNQPDDEGASVSPAAIPPAHAAWVLRSGRCLAPTVSSSTANSPPPQQSAGGPSLSAGNSARNLLVSIRSARSDRRLPA